MYFQWTDSLNTGIDEIDQQHRSIAEHINSLYRAKQSGDVAQVADVLTAMSDYTVNHFSFEEQLMEEAGYAFLRAHQRVHQLFINRINEYQERFASGEDITDELLSLLTNWLGNHIEQEDRGYLSSVLTVTTDNKKKSWLSGLVEKVFG